jgi:ribosomal-protein-alanine N-acetyltransferase
MTEIRRITQPADVHAAGELFDGPARGEATRRFLDEPGHHLFLAYDGDVPVGMVTGVETTHPDKGTEMFLYELSVAESHQGRGIGRALVTALANLAKDHGCYGMFVFTDEDNDAALGTYRSAGATQESNHVMLSWDFDPGVPPPHRSGPARVPVLGSASGPLHIAEGS